VTHGVVVISVSSIWICRTVAVIGIVVVVVVVWTAIVVAIVVIVVIMMVRIVSKYLMHQDNKDNRFNHCFILYLTWLELIKLLLIFIQILGKEVTIYDELYYSIVWHYDVQYDIIKQQFWQIFLIHVLEKYIERYPIESY